MKFMAGFKHNRFFKQKIYSIYHHNNSGNLRAGNIESTQLTQKLAHVA